MDDELRIEDEPRREDLAALDERLYRYSAAATGCDNGRWLAIFVRDAAGEITAGLHGWTWGRTGYVRTLWVREDLRRQGLGARLLGAAEREAVRRGCREMQLETHSYQAPGFYRRQGYLQVDELPGWPGEEHTRVFLRKAL
ncbi:MAG TPA: GNAT family N-acetyltransferase [Methylomirabilota bacterium]|jgi:ribosomal protein S18 acetylase RimI-like enzyme|nr:GNAT family N-acetyltransferase [Methylomirabilota bacterium]